MWWLLACSTPDAASLPFRLTRIVEYPVVTTIVASPTKKLCFAVQAGRVECEGQTTPLLDITPRVSSGGETGLLGLAFSPRWTKDPRLFLNYTYKAGTQLRTRISSFRVNGNTADPASEQEILSFDQPWANHNSGPLQFGPDGMLYIAIGDGGSGGDPRGTGQRTDDWLGSILRVDVRSPPYTVPSDNPFVGKEGFKPEIWAYGVRNPWGMHFDGATLWFADVGQDRFEEINQGVKGGNYGWNVMEATHCFENPSCTSAGFVAPVAEYSHEIGNSVTGGLVYRGPSIPLLDGRYLYADFVTGKLWGILPGKSPDLLTTLKLQPISFGTDASQRLYVADYATGVYRIDPL